VANEWIIDKNNYGYTGVGTPLANSNNMAEVRKDYVIDYTSWLSNVIMEHEGGVGVLPKPGYHTSAYALFEMKTCRK